MTHVPYGYKIEAGIAVLDEPAAIAIRNLFVTFIECRSMRAAAQKAGIEKTHSVVGRILKNKIYLGTDFYPQIIDDETFVKVQETRNTNARSQNRLRTLQPDKPLRINSQFRIGRVEKKYDNPYLQAQYAYSQIEERENEG